MISRAIKIYFVFFFIAVALYACKCKDQYDFLKVRNIFVELHSGTEYESFNPVFRDTLYVDLKVNNDCVAQSDALFDALLNTAKATKPRVCPCGEQGFRSPITELKIVTDSAYSGYPAGADITALFTAYIWDGNYNDGVRNYTYYAPAAFVGTLVESIRPETGEGWGKLDLFMTQKPNDTLQHSFTFQFSTSDTSVTVSTKKFKWI